MVRERNLRNFAYMDIASRKEKKRKKNKPPLGQRLQMRQYHVSKQRPQKKKESDKAAVLISLQIMTKKKINQIGKPAGAYLLCRCRDVLLITERRCASFLCDPTLAVIIIKRGLAQHKRGGKKKEKTPARLQLRRKKRHTTRLPREARKPNTAPTGQATHAEPPPTWCQARTSTTVRLLIFFPIYDLFLRLELIVGLPIHIPWQKWVLLPLRFHPLRLIARLKKKR
jgi:hypothetical protein